MAVPASKVRELGTASEVALVRASRKPHLDNHSHAELQQLARRARKLFDKWHGVGREQSRAKSKEKGVGEVAGNTKLKAQMFREALESIEARLAKLAKSMTKSGSATSKKALKKDGADHRAERAAVRKKLAEKKVAFRAAGKNKPATAASKKRLASVTASAPKQLDSATGTTEPAAAPIKLKKPSRPKRPAKPAEVDPRRQLKATVAAKQSRLSRSGITTRQQGHIAARGKRMQARRDAKE